jgi:tetratricopeptide (TPR) repeat protein
VQRIALDVLPPEEAVALLRQIIGADRVDREPTAAAELARRCAHLPLALRIAGDRITDRPQWSVVDLVADLAEETERLDVLTTEDDEHTQIRTVFSWSYRALAKETARAFRLLGLNQGPDISLPAAAALLGTATATARRHLNALTTMHLLDEPQRHRYQFHDLLRAYAAERVRDEEPEDAINKAVHRLLDWYLHTANAAFRVAFAQLPTITVDPPGEDCQPLDFESRDEALAWYDTEHANLLAAVRQAATTSKNPIAWQFPHTIFYFLELRYRPRELMDVLAAALAASQRLDSAVGEFWSLSRLGDVSWGFLDRAEDAIAYYRRAVPVSQRTGNRGYQGLALCNLGIASLSLDLFQDALDYLGQALPVLRETGDRHGAGVTLVHLARTYRHLRQFDQAIEHAQQSLAIFLENNNTSNAAYALRTIGLIYLDRQQFEPALDHFRQAHDIYREIDDRHQRAEVLTDLGQAQQHTGDLPAARDSWQEALHIFDELDSPQADAVRSRLATLGTQAPNQRP